MSTQRSYKSLNKAIPWAGLFSGPVLALITYLLLPENYTDTNGQSIDFGHAGRAAAAIAVWMAIWWLSEAIPIYVTALLPVTLFPLVGVVPIKDAAAPYAHYLIFLFLGGFIISLAMQRWGLHKRIALKTIRLVGSNPVNIIAGFMIATAGLSMWVSNTATTIMMTPIALSLLGLIVGDTSPARISHHPHAAVTDALAVTGRTHSSRLDVVSATPVSSSGPCAPSQRRLDALATNSGEKCGPGITENKSERNFSLCLLLSIAYSASIGGIGTLIGTPPNLFLASYIKAAFDHEISFVRWLGVGMPLVVLFLPLTWWLMTRWIFPFGGLRLEGAGQLTAVEYNKLGSMNRGEKLTLIVFLFAVLLWIFRPLIQKITILDLPIFSGLSDATIALLAALALFILPVDIKKREFVMNWEVCKELPWGILLLFGGGLSLAAAIDNTGVGDFIGYQVAGIGGIPVFFMIMTVCALIIFLTEITSNIATTATMVPILAAIGPMLGLHAYTLIVTAAIAASCAFMMPVATAPNAIVFSSGRISIPQMCRAGLVLNLLGIVLISLLMYYVALPLLGVTFS